MLPAEGYPGNRFALPAEVMQPTDVPRPVPEAPYDVRHYSIWFDFDSDFLRGDSRAGRALRRRE